MYTNASENSTKTQRLDKWLKISRVIKTRALATAACNDQRVKVNGKVAKAAKMVKAGDTLTIRVKGGKYRTLEIIDISHRSIAAKDAKLLYREEKLELSEEAQELMDMFWRSTKSHRPKYKGRPTKRERRRLDQIKNRTKLP